MGAAARVSAPPRIRAQGVAGSNPAAPTNRIKLF
jgi:hypothetical protein